MENLTKILWVAAGGAFGAVLRHLINVSPLHSWLRPFPLATFFINVSGSFVIGFLAIFFAAKFPDGENLRLAVIVGFLGAYTTFSTFELELWNLTEDSNFTMALVYLFASVAAGFAALGCGIWLAKKYF